MTAEFLRNFYQNSNSKIRWLWNSLNITKGFIYQGRGVLWGFINTHELKHITVSVENMILKMNAKSRRLDFKKRFMNFHTNSWNNQMRRAWGSRCVYFRWNTLNHQKLKEHKIIMANARKVLSRRRKYVAQAWHCHSSFGQTSRLPKVISCLLNH